LKEPLSINSFLEKLSELEKKEKVEIEVNTNIYLNDKNIFSPQELKKISEEKKFDFSNVWLVLKIKKLA
jgi:hypothetical protein